MMAINQRQMMIIALVAIGVYMLMRARRHSQSGMFVNLGSDMYSRYQEGGLTKSYIQQKIGKVISDEAVAVINECAAEAFNPQTLLTSLGTSASPDALVSCIMQKGRARSEHLFHELKDDVHGIVRNADLMGMIRSQFSHMFGRQ